MEPKEIIKLMQEWIDGVQDLGMNLTPDEINAQLQQMVNEDNSKPLEKFNGFSPWQMHYMIDLPLQEGCPVRLRTLTEDQIQQIPIMRQVLHLLKELSQKEIRLTSKGFLPEKVVNELYALGVQDHFSEYFNRHREEKTPPVHLVRAVLQGFGFIKKRNGRLSLTDKGRKLLEKDPNEILHQIIPIIMTRFNAGWFDFHEDEQSGNVGRLYALWLLHHFGEEWRPIQFYCDQYYKAFPFITTRDSLDWRLYKSLFYYMGLCQLNDTEADHGPEFAKKIRKTPLLDMMFSFEEPSKID